MLNINPLAGSQSAAIYVKFQFNSYTALVCSKVRKFNEILDDSMENLLEKLLLLHFYFKLK